MKQPPRKDRSAVYVASWNILLAYEIPFQLSAITMRHDLITKEAEVADWGEEGCVVFMKTIQGHRDRMRVFNDAKETAEKLSAKLAPLGLEMYVRDGNYVCLEKVKCKIRRREGAEKFKFDTPADAVAFINKVAAVFGNDPVSRHHFTMKVWRNVLISDGNGGRYWVDEAEWLAASAAIAAQKEMEWKLYTACLDLCKVGQGIKIALASSFDGKAAETIHRMRGVSFYFLSEAIDASKWVNAMLEYRAPFSVGGARSIAHALAPWVRNIEPVVAE